MLCVHMVVNTVYNGYCVVTVMVDLVLCRLAVSIVLLAWALVTRADHWIIVTASQVLSTSG